MFYCLIQILLFVGLPFGQSLEPPLVSSQENLISVFSKQYRKAKRADFSEDRLLKEAMLFEKQKQHDQLYLAYLSLAIINSEEKSERAFQYLETARQLAANNNASIDHAQGFALLTESIMAYDHRFYERSIAKAYEAIEFWTGKNEGLQWCATYNLLDALIYARRFEDCSKQIEPSKELLQQVTNLSAPFRKFLTLMIDDIQCICLIMSGNIAEGERIMLGLLEQAKGSEYGYLRMNTIGNLSYAYMVGERFEESINLAMQDLAYSLKTKNWKSVTGLCNVLIQNYTKLDVKDSAQKYIRLAEEVRREQEENYWYPDFLLALLNYHKANHDQIKVLQVQERINDVQDSVYKAKLKSNHTRLKVMNQLDRINTEISAVSALKTAEEEELLNQKRLLLAMTLVALFVGYVVFNTWKQLRQKNRDRKALKAQHEYISELGQELKEQEIKLEKQKLKLEEQSDQLKQQAKFINEMHRDLEGKIDEKIQQTHRLNKRLVQYQEIIKYQIFGPLQMMDAHIELLGTDRSISDYNMTLSKIEHQAKTIDGFICQINEILNEHMIEV